MDALGGDLVATPMQWAARNGYLYVIQLLIAHNADPTICDSQGYNTLHLVTHSSSIMPLLYLLHQPINVDCRDSQGHTPLMWAAYQGDALSVDLLLKHGASPNTRDEAGLTPLHWAVVPGNRTCIRRLVEKGAELGAKDGEGRTPRDVAVELKSLGAWKRALEEGGMNEDGIKRTKPFSDVRVFIFPVFSMLMVGPAAQYKNCNIYASDAIFLFDVYDTQHPALVHWSHSSLCGVFRNAPRKSQLRCLISYAVNTLFRLLLVFCSINRHTPTALVKHPILLVSSWVP